MSKKRSQLEKNYLQKFVVDDGNLIRFNELLSTSGNHFGVKKRRLNINISDGVQIGDDKINWVKSICDDVWIVVYGKLDPISARMLSVCNLKLWNIYNKSNYPHRKHASIQDICIPIFEPCYISKETLESVRESNNITFEGQHVDCLACSKDRPENSYLVYYPYTKEGLQYEPDLCVEKYISFQGRLIGTVMRPLCADEECMERLVYEASIDMEEYISGRVKILKVWRVFIDETMRIYYSVLIKI